MQLRRLATVLMVCALMALTGGLFSTGSKSASAHHVIAISAGGMHTCALTAAGGVQCWGRNDSGQLGDGTTAHSATPVNVVGLEGGVIAIGAGAVHTCAVTTAGGAKCWGSNSFGELGDGNSTGGSTVPVDVVGLSSGVAAIDGGFHHTCALIDSGGVKCWGMNWYGELGDGTTTASSIPVDVQDGASPLSDAMSITTGGGFFNCVLSTAGGVKCWGRNGHGQLGGTATDSSSTVDVAGLQTGVAAVAAGESHACALLTEGGMKCWGKNSNGQLGNGDRGGDSTEPVDVVNVEEGIGAITAAGLHTCALMTPGGVRCWGYNGFGQVGDGTSGPANQYRPTPVDVVGLPSGVVAVSAGGIHTCAMVDTGAVTCWGSDDYGQRGDSDGDGCTDFAEHGSDPLFGGLRDHENYWDFFDTPGADGGRDRQVSIIDLGGVIARFGTSSPSPPSEGEALAEAFRTPSDMTSYHAAYDRGGSKQGGDAWDLLPPDGNINITDVGAVVAQFGHSCA